jgi:hypothetical protein
MEVKNTIYLAGGMETAGDNGFIWREEITPHLSTLGYDVWNPYKEEINLGIDTASLIKLKETDYNLYLNYCQKIIQYDIKALLKCSMVACLIDHSVLTGAGTYGELTIAKHYNIPVYAWIDLPKGKYNVPSWAMGCLTGFADTQESFYALIPKNTSTTVNSTQTDQYLNEWSKSFSDY